MHTLRSTRLIALTAGLIAMTSAAMASPMASATDTSSMPGVSLSTPSEDTLLARRGRGADDPAGHNRRGRGTDDGAGHAALEWQMDAPALLARRGRGADDPAGHNRRGRGKDDAVGHG